MENIKRQINELFEEIKSDKRLFKYFDSDRENLLLFSDISEDEVHKYLKWLSSIEEKSVNYHYQIKHWMNNSEVEKSESIGHILNEVFGYIGLRNSLHEITVRSINLQRYLERAYYLPS